MILGYPDQTRNLASAASIPGRSYEVLRRHPQLLLFPLITMLACAGMVALLASGIALPQAYFHPWLFRANAVFNLQSNPHPATLLELYFAAMFLGTFFNVALYREVMRAYAGERPSLVRGLRFAFSRVVPVFTWTLFAASIGMIIRMVGQRFGWVGRLAGFLGGVTWSVAAVFSIPVLIREETSDPTAVLRHSSATVRRTWGDLVWGVVSLNFGLRLLLGGTVAFLMIFAVADPSAAGSIAELAIAIAVFAFGVWNNASQGVFRCALYIYATEGVIPDPFDRQDMDAVWKIKTRS